MQIERDELFRRRNKYGDLEFIQKSEAKGVRIVNIEEGETFQIINKTRLSNGFSVETATGNDSLLRNRWFLR